MSEENKEDELATGGMITGPMIHGQDQGEEIVFPSFEASTMARGGWLPQIPIMLDGHPLPPTPGSHHVGDVLRYQAAGDYVAPPLPPDPRWLSRLRSIDPIPLDQIVPVAPTPLTAEQVRAIVREEVAKALHPIEESQAEPQFRSTPYAKASVTIEADDGTIWRGKVYPVGE